MNLCFKNLGIMNLCTSARESWIARLWEKLNKIHVWVNCVRSRECRIWRLRESNFQTFFPVEHAPGAPYIIRAFGADSPLVSPITLCLVFSYKKNSMPTQNEWWYQVWMKQRLNTKEYKTRREVAPKKIIKSIGDDQKSSWITNLNSCRNHESMRQTTGSMNIKIQMILLLPPILRILFHTRLKINKD